MGRLVECRERTEDVMHTRGRILTFSNGRRWSVVDLGEVPNLEHKKSDKKTKKMLEEMFERTAEMYNGMGGRWEAMNYCGLFGFGKPYTEQFRARTMNGVIKKVEDFERIAIRVLVYERLT